MTEGFRVASFHLRLERLKVDGRREDRKWQMSGKKHDLVQMLKGELEFVQGGRYRKPSWRPQFIFEDSPTCRNTERQAERTPCTECPLMAFVPEELREEPFPCRHIPLTDTGETIDYFYRYGTQEELENALVAWLKKTIHELELSSMEIMSEAARGAATRLQIEEKTKCQL
jgi:hypothetical protein